MQQKTRRAMLLAAGALALASACRSPGEATGSDSTTSTATGNPDTSTSQTPTTDATTDPTGGASQSATGTTGPDATTGQGLTTGPSTTSIAPDTTTGVDPSTSTGFATTASSSGSPDTSNTTTGVPDMCPPVPDQDIKCTPCSQAHCCDEEAACHLDLDCACIYDCLAVDGQGLAFCAVTCMVANPADNPKIATVRDCRHANCESLCFP